MKKILIFGSGFSSSYILSYLLKESLSYNWHISVVDKNPVLAKKYLTIKTIQIYYALMLIVMRKEQR